MTRYEIGARLMEISQALARFYPRPAGQAETVSEKALREEARALEAALRESTRGTKCTACSKKNHDVCSMVDGCPCCVATRAGVRE